MNNQLQEFARKTLIEGLKQCSEGQQNLFKRMYALGKLSLSIEDVVANMPADKLDWAMRQVENTLKNKAIRGKV